MSRWQPNARDRLAHAALELYLERGFDRTTVADIARAAGLTERTFFRHFADKREVLFAGSAQLRDLLTQTIAGAPESATPIEAVAAAIGAAGAQVQQHRDFAHRRQRVIAANAELQERELLKLASLATALAGALRERGVPGHTAGLAAEAAVAVFKVSFERWIDDAGTDLPALVHEAFGELRAVASAAPTSG